MSGVSRGTLGAARENAATQQLRATFFFAAPLSHRSYRRIQPLVALLESQGVQYSRVAQRPGCVRRRGGFGRGFFAIQFGDGSIRGKVKRARGLRLSLSLSLPIIPSSYMHVAPSSSPPVSIPAAHIVGWVHAGPGEAPLPLFCCRSLSQSFSLSLFSFNTTRATRSYRINERGIVGQHNRISMLRSSVGGGGV